MLSWSIKNSADLQRAGLVEWAHSALQHADALADPARALTDERSEPKVLYAPALAPREAAALVAASAARFDAGWRAAHARSAAMVVAAEARVRTFGVGLMVAASSLGAECEREIEEEEEQEREVEPELPSYAPHAERDWDVVAAAADGLPACVDESAAVRLSDFVAARLPAPVGAIDWAPARGDYQFWRGFGRDSGAVWATANFARTLADAAGAPTEWSLFLRPVDSLLLFPNGDILLLSDREADAVVAAAWMQPALQPRAVPPAVLLQRCYTRDPDRAAWLAVAAERGGRQGGGGAAARATAVLPPRAAAQVQLFAGETSFGPRGGAREQGRRGGRAADVAELLRSREARAAALMLPIMRGLEHTLSHSQLEEVCEAGGAGVAA